MKPHWCPRLLSIVLLSLAPTWGADQPIDFNQARRLIERQRAGETLSPADRAYLERARAERARQKGTQKTGKAAVGRPRAANQRPAPDRITPLTDFADGERYEGRDGGLYGGGRNVPPEALQSLAKRELTRIQPLNAEGRPAGDGRVVLVAFSMSNATQEFSAFKRLADASPRKAPHLTIVDCAQGGQAMAEWASADSQTWRVAKQRLAAAGVTPAQVQVAWIKLANKMPSGSIDDHVPKLERDTLAMLQHARTFFPNLRIAYLGSRTYGGYTAGGLNPEPYAFEGAFAVRGLIERQMKGNPELALDRVPLLLWGPYLWADGSRGRKIDDLVWERSDFVADGVHPSETGRRKVAELLLKFFTTDPLAAPWFTKR